MSSLYVKVKVKVTVAKVQIFLFAQCKTSVGSNSSYVEDRAVKFACSVEFSVLAD